MVMPWAQIQYYIQVSVFYMYLLLSVSLAVMEPNQSVHELGQVDLEVWCFETLPNAPQKQGIWAIWKIAAAVKGWDIVTIYEQGHARTCHLRSK